MENSLKAIMIGAGVVITLIVVSIGFLLMRSGQSTMQSAIGKMDQMNADMEESQYTMYDNMEVRGREVTNVLKKFKNDYIGIGVTTKKNTLTWYIYTVNVSESIGTVGIASSNAISDTIDEKKDTYINPNGVFLGEVIRDVNGTIVALKFTQQ